MFTSSWIDDRESPIGALRAELKPKATRAKQMIIVFGEEGERKKKWEWKTSDYRSFYKETKLFLNYQGHFSQPWSKIYFTLQLQPNRISIEFHFSPFVIVPNSKQPAINFAKKGDHWKRLSQAHPFSRGGESWGRGEKWHQNEPRSHYYEIQRSYRLFIWYLPSLSSSNHI